MAPTEKQEKQPLPKLPENSVPELPENWDRCHFYVPKKHRFCRQLPHPSGLFCGNHQHLQECTKGKKRIPCPLDPSHWIYEDNVEKHVKICPQAKKRKRQEGESYFTKNVNVGGYGDLCLELPPAVDVGTVGWAERLALRVLETHQQIFGGTGDEPASSLTLQDLHKSIALKDISRQELDAGIVEGFQSHRIKSGGSRHIPQLASLVGHLREINVLPTIGTKKSQESPLVLLEMGAGRGMFGLAAAGVASAGGTQTHLVMVERAGSRSKADKVFRNLPPGESGSTYLELKRVQWSRIECDLAHVNLPVVLDKENVPGAKIVVIAKHLCGAGTDLALKSMESLQGKVGACVLATCCHGVCDWKEYVGRDYLRQKMEDGKNPFGPAEFDLLRRWCAGTVTCLRPNAETIIRTSTGSGNDKPSKDAEEDDLEHASGSPAKEDNGIESNARINISAVAKSLHLTCGVQGLGRACQRLIDHGRSEYLRKKIFADEASAVVELCHYVPPEVSPQNACLIAHNNRK
jgi:tRNA:m4X modification enzyme